MTPVFDLAIVGCGELLTVASPGGPKRGPALSEVGLIRNGVVATSRGKIAWVGTQKEYRRKGPARREIDAEGSVVLPGFVDPHTHAVFAGSREGEWAEKLRGVPYLEILKRGGGILRTVEATRTASLKSLTERAEAYLKKMLACGTTTVEIKSGYGLDLQNEVKILKVIAQLQKRLPLDLVPTFLGAHAIPKEYADRPEAYVDQVVEMLPSVRSRAAFCDVFCEEGAFSYQQSRRVLKAARQNQFGIKLHAGEFSDQGGVRLAAEFGARSVDHLDHIRPDEVPLLAESGAVGVLLPGVSHFLGAASFPPVRALVEGGVPVALATDFNPGSSPCLSMQEIIHLAVRDFKLTAAEAISAATINAAHAVGLEAQVGSLEVGKQADLLILDLEHYEQLPYFFGVNHVEQVLKKGKVVYSGR
ncbi:MAG: imidazolonepropionase [Nitrospirae bacterium]|nr:imidazolonepropionase [Candidatus Manganitrophaceae bacterium]